MIASLTPTSYLVLGLLAWKGPSTPYELKQFVEGSVGHFWPFPHTQLYTEPPRLVGLGLLDEEREHSGRRRRMFAITDQGLVALRGWLADTSGESTQIRDLALLKLFFSGLGDHDHAVTLAHAQVRAHKAKLADYERLDRQLADSSEARVYPRATLRMGLLYERAALAFWTTIAEQPPTA